jgi:CRISPR-associated protein Csd1
VRRLRLPPDKLDERRRLLARCALVKATLSRLPYDGGAPLEVSVSLDENSTRVPYLLGRLFAVLERLQGAAQGDINATIRDRWFGAASSTPAIVFPRLLRLSVHHAAKADSGGWYEHQKTRIVAALPADGFPPTLSLPDQGLFAVGYYHQRQKFFEKRAEAPADPTAPVTA